MAFTEFTVDTSAGSNLNAGAPTGGIYPVSSTNGAYLQAGGAGGTDRFTAGSGTPFSGIAVGDFVSVYADGAAAPTGFVGRVTAFTSTTLDISLTAIAGTRPTTAGSGITAVVGGAWKGPALTSGFPFGFITAALTDAAGDVPRVSGIGTSNITAAMAHSLVGPVVFQGMTTSPGDLGKWTIDGGTSGTSYVLLSVSGNDVDLTDLIFQNNGASASASGLSLTGSRINLFRVVVNSARGNGISLGVSNGPFLIEECEAYLCNQSATATFAGFNVGSNAILRRCMSHDHSASGTHGYRVGTSNILASFEDCSADSNSGSGIIYGATSGVTMISGCDLYNNGADGITLGNSGAASFQIENSNCVKNGGWGINGLGTGSRHGNVLNCGFGSGTQANTSGTTTGLKGIAELGSITYASNVTPWADPANGDFRINLAAAKGTGRGSFTQTQASYAGTVAYPDVGAGQHLDSPAPPLLVKLIRAGG